MEKDKKSINEEAETIKFRDKSVEEK